MTPFGKQQETLRDLSTSSPEGLSGNSGRLFIEDGLVVIPNERAIRNLARNASQLPHCRPLTRNRQLAYRYLTIRFGARNVTLVIIRLSLYSYA
jgi:hypothetical protein